MKKISLYIVEDYLLARISYKYALSQSDDLDLIGDFESAEECIAAMEKKPADVVLMDLGLENMNGIEATKIIKENHPETKVIILTSHESKNEVLACLSSGANGYALKDIKTDMLIEVIKTADFGAYWFDPQIEYIPLAAYPKPDSCDFNNLYPSSEQICSALTDREMEVLKFLVDGKSNAEIAGEMSISTHTAKAHVCSILEKLGVDDRVKAAVKAVRARIF